MGHVTRSGYDADALDVSSAQSTLEPVRGDRRSSWRFALVAFAITLVTAAFLAGAGTALADQVVGDRLSPGVSIAGVAVGGLGRAEAEQRLRASLPDVSAGALTLRIADQTTVIPYASVGRQYEFDAALAAAMRIGRIGGPIERNAERLQVAMRGVDVPLGHRYDALALDARIDEAASALERSVRDATVRPADDSWIVRESVQGRHVETAAARAQAHAALAGTGDAPVTVDAELVLTDPAITTAEAQAAADRAHAIIAADLVLADGDQTRTITAETIRDWVTLAPTPEGGFAADVDATMVEAAVAALADELRKPAVDASFAFGPGGDVVAVPGQDGRQLDAAATTTLILEALEARAAGAADAPVAMTFAATQPRYTTAQAEEFAPSVRRVSRWTTRFIPSDRNFFGENISIPTSKIDAQTVAPGKWFDFWKAIGKISRAEGYGPGGAIINGRTEPTGVIGGGLCSCSTTIFNAALRAGLQMGDRRNHYYYIDRYPVGLDATVFRSSSGATQSMRFKNDTDHPVLIRGINRSGLVRFEIWTVPTGRTVEFSEPRIRDRTSSRDTIEYTDDLAPGATERIEYPIDGFRSWVTRTVRDASGAVIHEDTYYSRYSAIDGITLVGRRPGDPPDGTIVVVGG